METDFAGPYYRTNSETRGALSSMAVISQRGQMNSASIHRVLRHVAARVSKTIFTTEGAPRSQNAFESLERRQMLTVSVAGNFLYNAVVGDKSPHKLELVFAQNVAGQLSTSDLMVDNVTTGEQVTGFKYASYNSTTKTAIFEYNPDNNSATLDVLPDANYRATLNEDAVYVSHWGSNDPNYVYDFYFLASDITGASSGGLNYPRDRRVTSADYDAMAASYGMSGKTYLQGNLDYDGAGKVDFDDLQVYGPRNGRILGKPATGPNDISLSTLAAGEVIVQWADTLVGESGWRVQISADGTNFESLPHRNVRGNQTSFTFRGLAEGKQYWFRVRGYSESSLNPNGPNSAYTPKASVTTATTTPEILSSETNTSGDTVVTLRRVPGATNYYSYQWLTGQFDFIDQVSQPSGTGNPIFNLGNLNGSEELFAFTAATTNYESGFGIINTIAPPKNVKVSIGSGNHFVLNWLPQGAAASGYDVDRRIAGTSTWTHAGSVAGLTASTFTDPASLSPNVRYQYQVTPANAGSATYSVISSSTADAIFAPVPLALPPRSGTAATTARGADGGDPASLAYSPDTGVRYADGTLRYETNDLTGEGLGTTWGVTRSWTNNDGYNIRGETGNGWMVNERPFLTNITSTTLTLVLSGTDSIYFVKDLGSNVFRPTIAGSTTTPAARLDSITLDATASEFRLATTEGRIIRFFATGATDGPVGLLKSVDSTGHVHNSGSTPLDGKPGSFSGDTTGHDEIYAYEWTTDAAGVNRISAIEMRRLDGSVTSVARRVEYKYYGPDDVNGNVGDLKFVKVFDAGVWNNNGTPGNTADDFYTGTQIDGKYYRYYTPGSTDGYAGGLKMAFDAKSFARMSTNIAEFESAQDATVGVYADLHLTYDDLHRIDTAIVQGKASSFSNGLGSYTYIYSEEGGKSKTVEIASLWTRTTYANALGEVLLNSQTDAASGKTWHTYHEYDSTGRLTLTANPSAITEAWGSDLLENVSAGTPGLEGLRDDAGLITKFEYLTTTNAPPLAGRSTSGGSIAGYLGSWSYQRGENDSAPDTQHSFTYQRTSFEGTVVGFVVKDISYGGADGADPRVTRLYYSSPLSVTIQADSGSGGEVPRSLFTSIRTYHPLVTSSSNGQDQTDYDEVTIDSDGRISSESLNDVLFSYTYEAVTGAITSVARGDSSSTTTMSYFDELGRPRRVRDANGKDTYYVYEDAARATLVYSGLYQDGGVWKTTGPVQMVRADYEHGFFEALEFAPTSIAVDSDGIPTGAEAVGTTMTSLKRSYEGVSGLVTQADAYFNLSGVAYDASTLALGAVGTNYYTSFTDYDAAGRLNREVNSVGTVTRYDFDGVGHALSKWIGTGDSPATGEWDVDHADQVAYLVFNPATQTNVASTTLFASNMTKVESYDYDDPNNAITSGNGIGIGDGNITRVTSIIGGTVADRVSDLHYDWRNRLALHRDGVEASQLTSLDRPVTYYTYDNLDQKIQTERYDGDTITSVSYTNGVPDAPASGLRKARSSVGYDERGRVFRESTYKIEQSGMNAGTVGASLDKNNWYSENGLVKKREPGGLTTEYAYNNKGWLATKYVTDGTGSLGSEIVLEQTDYTYDANGNVTFKTLKQRPHISTSTGPLADPPVRPTASSSHQTPGTTVRMYNTSYAYDAANRLTRSADIGANDGYLYDHGGSWTIPSRSTDSNFLVTDYSYDPAGHNDATTDPRGIVVRTYHDALGRVTRKIEAYTDGIPSDGDDRTTQYDYDGNNNVTLLTAVLPGAGFQKTAYRYGVLSAGTSPSAVFSNDLLGSVAYPNVTSGEPGPSEFTTYNTAGQSLTLKDRRGTLHEYDYDVLGRISSDTASTLATGVDSEVRRLAYTYDALGNSVGFKSYSDNTGSALVNSVLRTYDSLGRITNEYQALGGIGGDVSFQYDDDASGAVLTAGGRLKSMTYPDGRVLHYVYDSGVDSAISRVSSLNGADGAVPGQVLEKLSYLGLSTTVVRSHPEALTDYSLAMQHAGSGTWVDPESTSTLDRNDGDLYTGLDNHARISRLRWDGTDSLGYLDTVVGARDDFSYGYDQNGYRLYRANNLNHNFDELYHADGATAGYDKLNRLTDFQRGTLSDTTSDGVPDTVSTTSRSQSWTLDALGNWQALTGTTGGSSDPDEYREHNYQNAVTSVDRGGQYNTLSTNANGEMTRDERGQTYLYDAWGRLKTVDPDGDATTHVATVYTYDALSRRITEDADGSGASVAATHLYYTPTWQVAEERTVTGASTEQTAAQYVWSPVYIDAMVLQDRDTNNDGDVFDSGERLYVQQDANFNVTSLTQLGDHDANPSTQMTWEIVERYTEDAYGKPTVLDANWTVDSNGQSDVGNRYIHQGGRYDSSLKTSHFRFRELQVSLGRWMVRDPMGYSDSSNVYNAMASNPANRLDPDGRFPVKIDGPTGDDISKYEIVDDDLKESGGAGTLPGYDYKSDEDGNLVITIRPRIQVSKKYPKNRLIGTIGHEQRHIRSRLNRLKLLMSKLADAKSLIDATVILSRELVEAAEKEHQHKSQDTGGPLGPGSQEDPLTKIDLPNGTTIDLPAPTPR